MADLGLKLLLCITVISSVWVLSGLFMVPYFQNACELEGGKNCYEYSIIKSMNPFYERR